MTESERSPASGSFVATTEVVGGAVIVRPTGELDVSIAADLRQRLMEELDRGPDLVLDLTAVTFVDSSVLSVLVAVNKHARAAAGGFGIISKPRTFGRIFEITGLDQVLPIFSTVDDALARDEA